MQPSKKGRPAKARIGEPVMELAVRHVVLSISNNNVKVENQAETDPKRRILVHSFDSASEILSEYFNAGYKIIYLTKLSDVTFGESDKPTGIKLMYVLSK